MHRKRNLVYDRIDNGVHHKIYISPSAEHRGRIQIVKSFGRLYVTLIRDGNEKMLMADDILIPKFQILAGKEIMVKGKLTESYSDGKPNIPTIQVESIEVLDSDCEKETS